MGYTRKEHFEFPHFSYPLFAKPHKYETKWKLPVVIVPFMKNTDFMRVSEMQIQKTGKFKRSMFSFEIFKYLYRT